MPWLIYIYIYIYINAIDTDARHLLCCLKLIESRHDETEKKKAIRLGGRRCDISLVTSH
jgi:hypothetical protein